MRERYSVYFPCDGATDEVNLHNQLYNIAHAQSMSLISFFYVSKSPIFFHYVHLNEYDLIRSLHSEF